VAVWQGLAGMDGLHHLVARLVVVDHHLGIGVVDGIELVEVRVEAAVRGVPAL
jgi:hypothetical protein